MKKLKILVAFVLCFSIFASCSLCAFAYELPVKSSDMKACAVTGENLADYVEFFNESVNALKTDMPYATMTYSAGVPENGMTIIADDGENELDANAQKWLDVFFDGIFSENSSAFKSLISTLLGEDIVKEDSFVLHRGAKRNDSVPVYGEDYVSALTVADDYSLLVNQSAGSAVPSELALVFGDVNLEDGEKSSLSRVFGLPTGSIDAKLISGQDDETASFLESVKLDDLKFTDGRIVTKYGEDGKLDYYGSAITYDFTFSYFDAVKIVSAFLGFDLYKMCVETVDTIISNLGRDDISADSILLSRKMHVKYTVKVEITDIDFSPRYFGDIDDNAKVEAADARAALRHSVGLDEITATEDLMYGDINFDGEITAADARLILRTAVGMDELFKEVPEGCEVKIIVVEQEHTGKTDDTEDEDSTKEKFDGLFDFDPEVTPSSLVQFIFDTIENVENAEGYAKGDVESIIDIIRGIVNDSRETNDDFDLSGLLDALDDLGKTQDTTETNEAEE